jgi:hypothetical protein
MDSFRDLIYLNRDKHENRNISEEALKRNYSKSADLLYLGYEVVMLIEIFEDGTNKVLEINNIDVSDKDISI